MYKFPSQLWNLRCMSLDMLYASNKQCFHMYKCMSLNLINFICMFAVSASSSGTLKSWQQIRAKARAPWLCTRWSWWAAAAWANQLWRCSSCTTRWAAYASHNLDVSYRNTSSKIPSLHLFVFLYYFCIFIVFNTFFNIFSVLTWQF